jgi:hypothetical protein
VNASRDCEITRTERDGDRPHVITNDGFATRVRRFHLEYNATSVGQRLENVGRSVLIHAHCHFATPLEGGKSGVSGRRGFPTAARKEENEKRH